MSKELIDDKTKEQAIEVLASIHRWKETFDKINFNIKESDPGDDFCHRLSLMPSSLEGDIVRLLDKILGSEIASYFLYEVSCMKDGGSITEDGVTYRIQNIRDVEKYINHEKA